MSTDPESIEYIARWRRASAERYLRDYDVGEWRYQCPYCGAHTIVVRRMVGSELQHLEYQGLPFVDRRHRTEEIKRFRCDVCSETFDDPYDKKLDERRRLSVSD